MNTRILVSIVSLIAVSASLASSAFATVIGSGSVVSSGALNSPINWNDTFTTGSASGTINGIVIRGRILPVLNMVISGSGVLDLGNMVSTAASSGSVNIEL